MQNVDTRKFVKRLKANGYTISRQKGSHAIFHSADGTRHISVPITSKTVCGTMVQRLERENSLV